MDDPPSRVHLVVFVHGFEGTLHDFDNAEKLFLKTTRARPNQTETVRLLKPSGNSGFAGTYDGIEKGAVRVWREVMAEIRSLGDRLKAISIVGHSLGGLYSRYLLRLLNDCFVFDKVEPRYFVTLASPHLSVRRPLRHPANYIFHHVAKVVCQTTSELCLEDHPKKPLLYQMCDEIYTSVLRKFKRRMLYSNIANDFQVHYSTSSITMNNPYNRDHTKLARSRQYRDLTEWSLRMAEQRQFYAIDGIEEYARTDVKASLLRAMLIRLNELQWERYDALFPTVFAHEQIINKRTIFAGRTVMKHLCEQILDVKGESPSRSLPNRDGSAESDEFLDARSSPEPGYQISQI